ncbi:class I SAM-dependent methyltransferase [Bacteroides sp. OttesenSCG-928-D19]|nr:class I SAM-dependent methyltransferase [Bacteroides sp. OttesenSCG-928-D19]
MEAFWESSFVEKQTMWGFEPSESAVMAKDLFLERNAKDLLIPGIGYGRNAKIFIDNGMHVTGIEISKTAIELVHADGNLDIPIHLGSVTDMPFDNRLYDGIFCYALIHLLNKTERKKFIHDCFHQLKPGGQMIFSTISKKDLLYRKGKELSKDRFERIKGAKLFFYDAESIKREFSDYGLIRFMEIDEPVKFKENHPPMKFTIIICSQNKNKDTKTRCRTSMNI